MYRNDKVKKKKRKENFEEEYLQVGSYTVTVFEKINFQM